MAAEPLPEHTPTADDLGAHICWRVVGGSPRHVPLLLVTREIPRTMEESANA